jgi:hypothetical protein
VVAKVRGWLAKYRPRPLNMAGPLVQLFLNDEERTTTFTFANFASLYAPKGAMAYRYLIECRDPDGGHLGRKEITVPIYGARAIGVSDLCDPPLPEWGTIHVRLRSTSLLNRHDQHLGLLTPHFYALYHEREMRSLALVHPQTSVCAVDVERPEWRSNLLFDTDSVDALEVFQLNPSPRAVASELRIVDERGSVLARALSTVPAFGVRRERWVVQDLHAGRWVSIAADHLTAPNAKPLVFATNRAGLVSGSHS